MENSSIGNKIFDLAKKLYPICRSITGQGVRDTLNILKEYHPEMRIHSVPSGTHCFDWVVPKEWNISSAYVISPTGKKIIDFKDNNLHVVSYSTPIDKEMSLEELQQHLHSLPNLPNAIPYITSYYKETWGICLTHNQREKLANGQYRIVINSSLQEGYLNYGELYIPGELEDEIFLSTYICHPSMGNNELSGPVVTTFLAQWLKSTKRKYSYRIIFIPETIGSIVYLSKHYKQLKKNVRAGFNISCVGDDKTYSYLPTRLGNTLSDKVAKHVLMHKRPGYITYSFRDRGSDERQYCSPGIDLPIASVMRTKYGAYPEYHTSLDNLDFISPEGLYGGYEILQTCLQCLELNDFYQIQCLCEPQLGKRGLYPTMGTTSTRNEVRDMMDIIAYCDGTHDLLDIANKINIPLWKLEPILKNLVLHNLLKKIS